MITLLPVLACKPNGHLEFTFDDCADSLEVVSYIVFLEFFGVPLLFTHCFTPMYLWYPHGFIPHTCGITSIYLWHYPSYHTDFVGTLAFARAIGLFTISL